MKTKKLKYIQLLALLFMVQFAHTQEMPLWDPEGDLPSLRESIDDYAGYSDNELRALVDNAGVSNDKNIDMVYATYNFALLYHISQEEKYAEKTAVLLDEFANEFPNWPLDPGISRGHSMWWQDWYHRDLGNVARYLPQAYDLIAHTNAIENVGSSKDKVLELFRQIVKIDLESYPLFIFNAAGTRPLGLFIFARVLQDPELVHLAYWYYNKMVHYLFCYDGFTYEGTYEYGASIYFSLTLNEYKFYMDGYSDPPGFSHTPIEADWDKPRIDNLDVDAEFGDYYSRMKSSMWETALPDNNWPIMNETFVFPTGYSNAKYEPYRQPARSSRLLGGIGHAILANGIGSRQSQVRLDFSNSISHSHYDALHLIYYNKGTEVIGGTGYNEGDRDWNTTTINQNLVVVNGEEQDYDVWTYRSPSPYIPGTGRIAGLPDGNEYPDVAMHNNILLFEKDDNYFNGVQLVLVDATPAYESQDLDYYHRFLAQVKIDNDNEYIIDLFTVKGGTQYDWMLHGGHDDYEIDTPFPMSRTSGNFGQIDITDKTLTPQTWNAELKYDNVHHKLTMYDNNGGTLYKGQGPRSSKQGGMQDYIFNRNQVQPDDMVTFKVLHETYTNAPQILAINKVAIQPQTESVISTKVNLTNNRIDYFFYRVQDELDNGFVANIQGKLYFFQGKFFHLRFENNKLKWVYLVNGKFQSTINSVLQTSAIEKSGTITQVQRIKDGYRRNAFILDSPQNWSSDYNNRTLIVKWGNDWTWGYKISSVTGNIIYIADEPGFVIENNRVNMKAFPAGNYPGPVTFSIAGRGIITGDDLLNHNSLDIQAPQPPQIDRMRIIE